MIPDLDLECLSLAVELVLSSMESHPYFLISDSTFKFHLNLLMLSVMMFILPFLFHIYFVVSKYAVQGAENYKS
jgi:hypothetical protein